MLFVREMYNNEKTLKMVEIVSDIAKYFNVTLVAEGFQAAHGLKGIISNLELTPILKPVSEITELFRNRSVGNYKELLEVIKTEREKLEKMCE